MIYRKEISKISIIMFVLLINILFFVLTCSKYKVSNPVDPNYQGDYKLEINWSELPDTLYIGREYVISIKTGRDTFAYYDVRESQRGYIDESRLGSHGRDSICLYFEREFGDTLVIRGIRPNGKEMEVRRYLRVVSSERPVIIIGGGEINVGTGYNSIGIKVVSGGGRSSKLYWKTLGKGVIDSSGLIVSGSEVKLSVEVVVPGGWDSLYIWAIDVSGMRSDTVRVGLRVIGKAVEVETIRYLDSIYLGDTLTAEVVVKAGSEGKRVRLVVRDKIGSYRDSSGWYITSQRDYVKMMGVIRDTGMRVIESYVVDSNGVSSGVNLDTVRVVHKGFRINVGDSVIQGGKGEETVISVVDIIGNVRRYIWKIDGLTDTTTEGRIKKVFNDTGEVRVLLVCEDGYGYRSDGKIIRIIVKPYEYGLKVISYPETIVVNREYEYSVVVSDEAKFYVNGGEYKWKVKVGGQESDSVGANKSSIKVRLRDSVDVVIGVKGQDTLGGGTSEYIRPIVVRVFRPVFEFVKERDSVRIGSKYIIRSRVYDTDVGGLIDSVYWDINGDGIVDVVNRDSVYETTWNEGGEKLIVGYCRDREGNYSRRDSLRVVVKADRPYFDKQTPDTVIYVGSSAIIRCSAVSGASGVLIDRYIWKMRGVVVLDTTTSINSFTRVFNVVGRCSVYVSCVDRDGIESANGDTFVVVVSSGGPVVSGIKPDSVYIKDDVRYVVGVREINPNGKIEKVYVDFGEGGGYTSRTDSVFTYSYSSSGNKRVSIYAVDNFGNVSDTVIDSVYVKLGKPEVLQFGVDTSRSNIFINDNRVYKVKCRDEDGYVDSVIMIIGTEVGRYKARGDSVEVNKAIKEAGIKKVKIVAKDNKGIYSDTLEEEILVRLGKPVIKGVSNSPQDIYVGSVVKFTIMIGDTNGSVDSIKVDEGRGSGYGLYRYVSYGSIAYEYNITFAVGDTGNKVIKIRVKDNDGIESEDFLYQVKVNLGLPQVRSISYVPQEVSVGDSVRFVIKYSDVNGRVDSIRIDDGRGFFTNYVKVIVDSQYEYTKVFMQAEGGSRVIRVQVKDNSGLESIIQSVNVLVNVGRPQVMGVAITPVDIYAGDTISFVISYKDSNASGRVDSIKVDNGSGVYGSYIKVSGNQYEIRRVYGISEVGNKTIRVIVKDNAGIESEAYTKGIVVRLGKPVVGNISYSGDIYINRDINFSVLFSDSGGGYIDSIKVDKGSGVYGGYVKIARGSTGYNFVSNFGISESGNKRIRVVVKDNIGIESDEKVLDIYVKLGRPQVSRLLVDTIESSVFVNDFRNYTIVFKDSNSGYIRGIYVNWHGGMGAETYIGYTGMDTAYTLSHIYDTLEYGLRSIRVWVKDNDSLRSDTLVKQILVRKGSPVIWADRGDTIIIPVNRGYTSSTTKYYAVIHAYDTNGTIQTYYWGNDPWPQYATTTPTCSLEYEIDGTTLHLARSKYIYVKDDDGYVSGGMYYIYPDSAPPKPVGLAYDMIGTDTVRLMFDTTLDKKDRENMLIRIELCYGTDCTPSQPLLDWTPAYQFSVISYGGKQKRIYKFKKSQSGDDRWKVLFKDRNGLISESDIAPISIQ